MAKRKKIYQLPNAPLKRGDKGMHVVRLQEALDLILKYKGKTQLQKTEKGWYGVRTAIAVYKFRDDSGIRADFDFDETARQKLREVLSCR